MQNNSAFLTYKAIFW